MKQIIQHLTFLLLSAASLCAQTATNESVALVPAYGEIPPTFWEQHGTTVLIGSLLFVALASLVAWLIFQPKPQPLSAPEAVARKALAQLRGQAETGTVVSEISQIVRRYLCTAFGLSGGEPTTAELVAVISLHEQVGPELAQKLADFLHECDERKFSTAPAIAPLGGVERALKLVALAEQRRWQSASQRPAIAAGQTTQPRLDAAAARASRTLP